MSTFAVPAPLKPPIHIRRTGALGDVILLTPIVRALHSAGFPTTVFTAYPEVFRGWPTTPAPFRTISKDFQRFGQTFPLDPNPLPPIPVNLDLSYERQPDHHPLAAALSVARAALGKHVTALPEYTPSQPFLTRYSGPSALAFLDDFHGRVFGHAPTLPIFIHAPQPPATWRNRAFPLAFWRALTEAAEAEGRPVVAVGRAPHDLCPLGAVDARLNPKRGWPGVLSIHALATLFAHYAQLGSILVAPDSAVLHVAQTTDLPCVGLFTCAFPNSRLSYRPDFHGEIQLGARVVSFTPDAFGLPCGGCLHRLPAPTTFCACPERGDYACVSLTQSQILSLVMHIRDAWKFLRDSAIGTALPIAAKEKGLPSATHA